MEPSDRPAQTVACDLLFLIRTGEADRLAAALVSTASATHREPAFGDVVGRLIDTFSVTTRNRRRSLASRSVHAALRYRGHDRPPDILVRSAGDHPPSRRTSATTGTPAPTRSARPRQHRSRTPDTDPRAPPRLDQRSARSGRHGLSPGPVVLERGDAPSSTIDSPTRRRRRARPLTPNRRQQRHGHDPDRSERRPVDRQDRLPAGARGRWLVTYTLTVHNDGPSTATGVTVTDPLDEALLDPSATTTVGSCAPIATDGVLTCTLGTLASGADGDDHRDRHGRAGRHGG